jgi:L-iditol 2-dehydrogenase
MKQQQNATMQAVRWHGPRDMRVEEAPIPTPRAHEALIRIASTGVCGSDLHYYLDGRIGSQVVTPPLILGHEYAGVVEAAGADVDPSLLGKRVAVEPGIPCLRCEFCQTGHYNVCREMFFPGGPGCDGALCEYIAVHAAFCFPIPDEMSMAEAAMIEPVAVAVHTVELAALKPGDTAAIFGLGPIGLLTAQVAKQCGVSVLYGADLLEYRVEAGKKAGVDGGYLTETGAGEAMLAWLMEETRGRGVDVAIDCTNSSEGLSLAVQAARPAGRCVLTGISGEECDTLPVSVARRRELTLQWCRRFRHNFPAAIRLMTSGTIEVNSLITHSFPLAQTREAFELVAANADGVLKVSIDQ